MFYDVERRIVGVLQQKRDENISSRGRRNSGGRGMRKIGDAGSG